MKSNNFLSSIKFLLTLLFLISLVMSCKKTTAPQGEIGLTGDPAIDGITEAIQSSPEDPTLYFKRSEIFYERQAYDQAIADLATVLKLDSTNLKAHHLLADVYMDSYQSARALPRCNGLLAVSG